MSGEILSQAEVENLLSSLDSSKTSSTPRRRPREKVTTYDFKRPERVGKEQMRALQTIHEGFARNFGASLSALLRSILEVKLTSVDQLTYSEFVFSLENPTCFNVLQADPLEGNLILDLSPSIIYPIIDRLLGGGREPSPPARRPLTDIELRLVGKITDIFLEELAKAWENVLKLNLQVVRVESNPHLVQIVPPNEVIVLVSFELALGDVRGMVNLCIPYNSIERIAGRLLANSWTGYRKLTPTEETKKAVSHNLEEASVELVVELAQTTIRAQDLLELRVGDVITTGHDVRQPLVALVEGVPKFLVAPGMFKGHKAIRVLEVLPPEDPPTLADELEAAVQKKKQ